MTEPTVVGIVDLTGALLSAVGALVTGIVALFWIYIKQRDQDEKRYQEFTEKMLPLLTQLKRVGDELSTLVRELIRNSGDPHDRGHGS